MRPSALRRVTGPRHTTQEHPFEVVIHYPHHPRAGECVVALRRLIHGNRPHFVIEQPDGCCVLLPACMTESYAATLPMVAVPRLALAALRELRRLVQLVSSLPFSETTRMGGGDGETATARTRAAAQSAGARKEEHPIPAARVSGGEVQYI